MPYFKPLPEAMATVNPKVFPELTRYRDKYTKSRQQSILVLDYNLWKKMILTYSSRQSTFFSSVFHPAKSLFPLCYQLIYDG
jgi:hypothetical protein